MPHDTTHPAIGYLHLPIPEAEEGTPPPDLARACDLLADRAPAVEPDAPAGAWFALREGKRAPAPDAAGHALLATLANHGYPGARLAFAPTPGVARLAALVAAAPLTLLAAEAVPAFLAPLPVETLDLGDDATDRLRLVGLHTLGALADLPRGTLGDYLGPLGTAVEALARGDDHRPLVPRRPALTLRVGRDLDWPLADRAQLTSLLGQLLAAPLAHLARQGLGTTRVALRLATADRTARAVARLPAPTAAAPVVLAALLAAADRALAKLAPATGEADASDGATSGGITAVHLALVAPRPLPARQASFFDVPQGRLGQLHAGLAEARRRGDGTIGYLRPVALDHPRPALRYLLDPEALPPSPEAAS